MPREEFTSITLNLVLANLLFAETGLQINLNSDSDPLYISGTKQNLLKAVHKAEELINSRKAASQNEDHLSYYDERLRQLGEIKCQLK